MGGIGVKPFSTTYMCTRVVFIIKMLNHEVKYFSNIARRSLELDMKKRGVRKSNDNDNFLGYKVTDDGYLESNTYFECKTDWIKLNRYCRKLSIKVQWKDDKANVLINQSSYGDGNKLNKILYNHAMTTPLMHAKTLSLQGSYLGMDNIDEKSSHTCHYNWKTNDQLLIFCIKARLNILPTNFTTFIWNRDNNPRCHFCNHTTESMAHLLNGCQVSFGNFYSRRHDRIVDHLYEYIKKADREDENVQ